MSLSPVVDSPFDGEGINSVRMNLDEDFLNLQEEKKDSAQSDTMPVFIRVRPMLPQEDLLGFESCLTILENSTIRAEAPVDSARYKASQKDRYHDFKFSHAFGPNVGQLSFFEETMSTTVKNFIEGQNALIFAYGSSGSGKTFTMQGAETEPGIIPLTVQLLFQCIQGKQLQHVPFKPFKVSEIVNLDTNELLKQSTEKEKLLQMSQNEENDGGKTSILSICSLEDVNRVSSFISPGDLSMCPSFIQLENSCRSFLEFQGDYYYSVWVSFVELYNEQVFDLFQPFTKKKRQTLSLGEDQNGNIFVKGLKEVSVSSSTEVLKLLRLGQRNLKIATTKLNYQSSRSHCIFNVKIVRTADEKNPSRVFVNTLSFCDLAGSERCGKTQNTGMRLKEASNINTSLMVLGRCIEMLRQNQFMKEKRLIPFRESKLTRLFSSFFIGKGKASMIVNVSPSSHTFDETLNVLKFSALAQQVTMKDCPLSKELSRLTELLNNDTRLSSGSCRESIDSEFDVSMALEEREGMIQEVLMLAQSLEEELMKERKEKAEMETELYAKLKEEYFGYIAEMKQQHRKEIDEIRAIYNQRAAKRTNEILSSITADTKTSDSEDEDDEGSNSENDEDGDHKLCKSEQNLDASNVKEEEDMELENLRNELEQANKMVELKKAELAAKENEISALKHKEAEKERIYESTLTAKDADLISKSEELANMQSVISDLKASLSSKETELQQARTELIAKDNDLQAKSEEIAKIQSETSEMQASIRSMEIEMEQIKNKLMMKDKDLVSKDDEIENLQTTLSEVNASTQLMETELEKTKSLLAEKENLLSSKTEDVIAKEKIDELNNVISIKESEVEKLQNLLEEKENNLSAKTEDLIAKEKTIVELRSTISLKEIELEEAKKFAGEKEADVSLATKDIIAKETMISELHNTILLKVNELEVVKAALKEKENELLLKTEDIASKEKAMAELTNAISTKENELEELKNLLSQKESDLMSKLEEIAAINKIVAALNDSLSRKDSDLIETKAVLKEKASELLHKLDIITADEKRISELVHSVTAKEAELEEMKRKLLKEKETDASSVMADLGTEQKTILELNQTITLMESELVAAKEQLKEKENELLTKTEELSSKEKIIVELNETISSNGSELEEAKSLLEKKENDLLIKTEELNSKEKKIVELNKNISSKDVEISKQEDIISKTADILLEKETKLCELMEKNSQLAIQALEKNLLPKNVCDSDTSMKSEVSAEICDLMKSEKASTSGELFSDNDESIIIRESLPSKQDQETLIELLKLIELKATKNTEHLVKENISLKREISDYMHTKSKKNEELPSEWTRLVPLLQDIEIVSHQNTIDLRNKSRKKSDEIASLSEKVAVLTSKHKELESEKKNMERLLSEKEASITDLEQDEWTRLVQLLQDIESVSYRNTVNFRSMERKKSEEIASLNEKIAFLMCKHEELESDKKKMERLLSEREASIIDLEQAMVDQKHLEEAERNTFKQQYDAELEGVQKLNRLLEKENTELKGEKESKLKEKVVKDQKEAKPKLLPESRVGQVKKLRNLFEVEDAKENLSDADFEPKKQLRPTRATRSNSNISKDSSKEPPKRSRATRISNRKNSKVTDDSESVTANSTSESSSMNGQLSTTYCVSSPKKNTVPASPLDKVKSYVADVVPKIKTAAQHVSAYLSPVAAKRTSNSQLTGPVKRKRKLYTVEDQPVLAQISPVESAVAKEPGEKKTRQRQTRRQCR